MSARTNLYLRLSVSALTIACLAAVTGCESDDVTVASGGQGSAYGRDQMLAAIEAFAKSDRSAQQYRRLAATMEGLTPRFDQSVRREAELHMLVLALSPLEANYQKSPDERLEVLGTTVWPTAIGVPPLANESPQEYGERICAGPLALECKHVVPEYRSLMLSAWVWEQLQERATTAIRECKACDNQPVYREVLTKYERHERDVVAKARKRDGDAKPSRWPLAGDNALPWSQPPLLEFSSTGVPMLQGNMIEPGTFTQVLRGVRQDSEVLGVFIKSSARISELRSVLGELRQAGFNEVALQVRQSAYPYKLAEYRLATDPGQQTVRVRDGDSIQVLVQALDAIAITGQRTHRI